MHQLFPKTVKEVNQILMSGLRVHGVEALSNYHQGHDITHGKVHSSYETFVKCVLGCRNVIYVRDKDKKEELIEKGGEREGGGEDLRGGGRRIGKVEKKHGKMDKDGEEGGRRTVRLRREALLTSLSLKQVRELYNHRLLDNGNIQAAASTKHTPHRLH